jgi:NCAIR mutase (PurE)-related protein
MKENIQKKIRALKTGLLSEDDFLAFIRNFPFSGDTRIKLDFHRKLRRGLPEVIFGRSKSIAQLKNIIGKFAEVGEEILITRVEEPVFAELKMDFPRLKYHSPARIITGRSKPKALCRGRILVLSAGASDEPVAEEAYVSSLYLGNPTDREYDIGVACLPRILSLRDRLNHYSVIIVVAGMEGALPSVVAGLTATPIVAVPSSVGYGANFHGMAALLAMLNSCSGGVSVVNIDNGFGAAFQATLINRKISGKK